MVKAEILRPSGLGTSELVAWSQMLAATPDLQRAFFTPDFSRACELAHARAFVAVLHERGVIRAFMPFQFRSAWHQRIGVAERIGGELCDNAGLVAQPGFTIDPASLLQCCGLGVLFLTHLMEGQDKFGLVADQWEIGHRIDLCAGSSSYFAALKAKNRSFVQDTERRMRRAAQEYGPLTFASAARPERRAVMELVADKRQQYRRTGATDVFADPVHLRLIEALSDAASVDCMPMLATLSAHGRVLARHLGLLHAGVLNYWFPVYDAETRRISPGRLLLWHTLKSAETLAIRLVDRGNGDSEAKRNFSTGTVRFGRANFVANTARGAVARLYQAAEWRLRPLLVRGPRSSGDQARTDHL
jgi:CelD/BcsL family acetyltransferase involved in cellulose biosynthesis